MEMPISVPQTGRDAQSSPRPSRPHLLDHLGRGAVELAGDAGVGALLGEEVALELVDGLISCGAEIPALGADEVADGAEVGLELGDGGAGVERVEALAGRGLD